MVWDAARDRRRSPVGDMTDGFVRLRGVIAREHVGSVSKTFDEHDMHTQKKRRLMRLEYCSDSGRKSWTVRDEDSDEKVVGDKKRGGRNGSGLDISER